MTNIVSVSNRELRQEHFTSRHLHVQSQQWKHLQNAWNPLKDNNENTRTTSIDVFMALLLLTLNRFCILLSYFYCFLWINIGCFLFSYFVSCPANIYLFKVNNRNSRKKCGICPRLTVSRSGVFMVNFEHISHIFGMFLLLYWTSKC